MDACYRSAKSSRAWEPVDLEWRGGSTPADHVVRSRVEDGLVIIKEEHLPDGRRKVIGRDESGTLVDRILGPD